MKSTKRQQKRKAGQRKPRNWKELQTRRLEANTMESIKGGAMTSTQRTGTPQTGF